MSEFLLIGGPWGRGINAEQLTARLNRTSRGALHGAEWRATQGGTGFLASTLPNQPRNHEGAAQVGVDTGILLGASATLYYRGELRERIRARGFATRDDASTALIAHAYNAFGAKCCEFLEGDFAFAIWDAATRTSFAARDPFGTRGLYYLAGRDGIAFASSPQPLRALGGWPGIDRADIARSLLLYHGDGSTSPWLGIRELPAGWSIVAAAGRGIELRRYWYPASNTDWAQAPQEEAALILRELLAEATAERADAPSLAIAMSGGRDSTALVGALEMRRKAGDALPSPGILSFRYPDGDPGNEDDRVNSVASRFDLPITWIDADSTPLLSDSMQRAALRPRADAQPFEGMNRALARAAVAGGSGVLLNGVGGDSLFGIADDWMADLLRRGRLIRLRRELRARGYSNWRGIRNVCVRSAIPFGLIGLAEGALDRMIPSRPWEQHPPPWFNTRLREWSEIVAADREHYRRDICSVAEDITQRVRLWSILYAGFQRNCAALFEMSTDEGVELRTPFFDVRLANFAWSRPREDLSSGAEQKVILRLAMQGILPDEVIAPRRDRGGSSAGYFRRAARREFTEFARAVSEPMLLADLELVNPRVLRQAVSRWESVDPAQQIHLFLTLHTEWWLRAQNSP